MKPERERESSSSSSSKKGKRNKTVKKENKCMYLSNPSTTDRMWQKINFWEVFLLLDWLPKITVSPTILLLAGERGVGFKSFKKE